MESDSFGTIVELGSEAEDGTKSDILTEGDSSEDTKQLQLIEQESKPNICWDFSFSWSLFKA